MKAIVVVPTIREQCIQDFLQAWQDEFSVHRIIVVEDNPTKTFKLNQSNVTHYALQSCNCEAWVSTGDGVKPREMLYYHTQRTNECVLNQGMYFPCVVP